MNAAHRAKRVGRIVFRADDERLTAFAGLAVIGALTRTLGLVGLLDGELARERRAAPVKVRARGVSGGELLLALAESQLIGGECFDDIEELRADAGAGAGLRGARRVPAASTARQLARRFRRCHIQAVERAIARVGGRLDRALGRDAGEDATIDLDATQLEVHGPKGGAARSRHGCVAYAPHIAFWAQRGRALTAELVGGNQEKLTAAASATLARRALRMLRSAGHSGNVTFRVDSAYSSGFNGSNRPWPSRNAASARRSFIVTSSVGRKSSTGLDTYSRAGGSHRPGMHRGWRRNALGRAPLRDHEPRSRRTGREVLFTGDACCHRAPEESRHLLLKVTAASSGGGVAHGKRTVVNQGDGRSNRSGDLTLLRCDPRWPWRRIGPQRLLHDVRR